MRRGRSRVADRMAFSRQAKDEEEKINNPVKTPSSSSSFSIVLARTNYNNCSSSIPSATTVQTAPLTKQDGKQQPPQQLNSSETDTQKVASPQRKDGPRQLKKKPVLKRQMSVSSLVLTWCQDVTRGYKGVNIKNFSGSFSNGLAFCALIHKFNPDKIDYDSLDAENREYNVRLAFETGIKVGIPALYEAKDFLRMEKPEPRSVQCYVQMIFSKYRPKDLDMSNLRIA